MARLESEGVKRSPSHFCSSASPEGLHAQPPREPFLSNSARPLSPPNHHLLPACPPRLRVARLRPPIVHRSAHVPGVILIVPPLGAGIPDPHKITRRLSPCVQRLPSALLLLALTNFGTVFRILVLPAQVRLGKHPGFITTPSMPMRAPGSGTPAQSRHASGLCYSSSCETSRYVAHTIGETLRGFFLNCSRPGRYCTDGRSAMWLKVQVRAHTCMTLTT